MSHEQIQMQICVTGINTLRINNLVKQGQDHASDGFFIRKWIPELEPLSVEEIHEP